MRTTFARIGFFAAILLAALSSRAADAPFAGKFSDGNLSLDLTSSADGYSGTLTLHNQQYPAVAHANGQRIDGTFTAAGTSYPFNATLDADTLTLSTGASTYKLKELSPATNSPPNPPTNPANANSGDTSTPAGYAVVTSIDSGKSLSTHKANITKLYDALVATFSDLAGYFGNRPTLGAAFQDAQDPASGGATFTATSNGQPVRGVISCKLQDGAAISVIYLRADAPKEDWEKLMAQTAIAAIPSIPLKQCDYVDGTGSVGLADGWSAQAPSAVTPFAIKGPADQTIMLHSSVNVNTPDSPAAQQYQKHMQLMAQHPGPGNPMSVYAVPTAPILIAPLTDPATALSVLVPQFSAQSEYSHGPSMVLDKIISSRDVPSAAQGVKAAVITFEFTLTLRGQSTSYRERTFITISPLSPGAWTWNCIWDVQGPVATFDQDLPVMMAMVNSQKGNPERIAQVVDAIIQQRMASIHANLDAAGKAQQEKFEQFQRDQQARQQMHDEQMAQTQAGYDQINQDFKDHELSRSRGDADKVESILGTRKIYDTVTGESGYAKLTDVNAVVDSLNQAALDPDRFKQIPLRDQLYPLPAGK